MPNTQLSIIYTIFYLECLLSMYMQVHKDHNKLNRGCSMSASFIQQHNKHIKNTQRYLKMLFWVPHFEPLSLYMYYWRLLWTCLTMIDENLKHLLECGNAACLLSDFMLMWYCWVLVSLWTFPNFSIQFAVLVISYYQFSTDVSLTSVRECCNQQGYGKNTVRILINLVDWWSVGQF